jgi:hypothetical protein
MTMFVGLVKDPGRDWRPWDDTPDPSPHRSWRVPWRLIFHVAVWVAIVSGMFAAVPLVDHEIGEFAGYVLILLSVAVGVWRVDRWFDHGYWEGLREYHS